MWFAFWVIRLIEGIDNQPFTGTTAGQLDTLLVLNTGIVIVNRTCPLQLWSP